MSWIVRDVLSLYIATPVGMLAFAVCLMFCDYFIIVPRHYLLRALFGPPRARDEELPSGLLVIPTLMRRRDELEAIEATIANVLHNGYPGDLLVVGSIDGFGEAPALYAELQAWIAAQQASLPPRVWLYLTGTPQRRGKPLAIDHGVELVKDLVARGVHREFPKIYFSTDADADLGPHALEHLARRLCKRNFLTGSPGRAVAGNLYVRGNAYWQGLRHFFTVEGQLSIQVAREYLVTNVARHNKRPFPLSGITGVLYGMWTDIFLQGPRFFGFMRTLRLRDWLKWWVGFAPPRFSESRAEPIPELMAGDTDDTVSAFLAIIARWENGRFTLDAPRSPLHALYYLLRAFFVDRALRYEPEARVYTSSPTTLKSLWKQRVRWNTARIEVAGRFSRSFLYHWDLGVSAIGVVMLILKYVFFGLFYYVTLPFLFLSGSFSYRVGCAYALQLSVYLVWTTLALLMNAELRKNWRLLLALPMAPWYILLFSFWTTFTGVLHDLFLFGNVTRFAPERTLIRGASERVAVLARLRRAAVLTVRSALYGDVPFGAFWFGWDATPWTPSGYEGWSSGKRPSLRARLRYGAPRPDPNAARLPQPEPAPGAPAAAACAPEATLAGSEPARGSHPAPQGKEPPGPAARPDASPQGLERALALGAEELAAGVRQVQPRRS